MAEEDFVEIKFRLYDGSDIGPFRYSSAATVDMVKQRIVSDWPEDVDYLDFQSTLIDVSQVLAVYFRGKAFLPKSANEVKLISSGKILENNMTIGECKTPFGNIAGGVITMHVVLLALPPLEKSKSEKKVDDPQKKVGCSCSIM